MQASFLGFEDYEISLVQLSRFVKIVGKSSIAREVDLPHGK